MHMQTLFDRWLTLVFIYSFIHIVLTVLLTLCHQWRKSQKLPQEICEFCGSLSLEKLYKPSDTLRDTLWTASGCFLMRQTSRVETSSSCVKTSYPCFSDVVCIRRVRKSEEECHERSLQTHDQTESEVTDSELSTCDGISRGGWR